MENLFVWHYIVLLISIVIVASVIIVIFKLAKKEQLHYFLILDLAAIFIWCIGQLFLSYYQLNNSGNPSYILITFYYIGVSLLPPFLLLTGVVYYKEKIVMKPLYYLLFIPSLVSLFLAATIKFNQLLFIKYSYISSDIIYGPSFTYLNIITSIYILIGFSLLLYTSVKKTGILSRQSLIMIVSILIPITFNILISIGTIKSIPLILIPTPIALCMVLIVFAIFNFSFMPVKPVALSLIFNQLSDGIIVINEHNAVLDYNKTTTKIFKNSPITIEKNKNIIKSLSDSCLHSQNTESLCKVLETVVKTSYPRTIEKVLETETAITHLSFTFSNVTIKNKYYCTTILMKDITEIKNKIEVIEENQKTLMEKERLASLGNLIGGIAHNLKTPIMTISGVSDTLSSLGREYRDSINDPLVSKEDHMEIANDIIEWSDKVMPYCSYMSEMITAVKGQATQLSTASEGIFTLRDLLSRIRLLMKFELNIYHCNLIENIKASQHSTIKGDISSLIQVFNNIITNAIQSYHGKHGIINLDVMLYDGQLQFTIADHGSGMDDNIKKKLFKEMVTTKGKEGTGLGLYMAYSTIRGHFNGELTFDSELEEGTTFYITIPSYKEINHETK